MVMYGCKFIVNQIAFYPDKTNVLSKDSLPSDIKEFFVNTEDQIKVQGLYLPLASSDKVLIYFHGNAGNIYNRIPDLIQLQQSGVNVIGAGYRGYGKSEGSPSEEGIYRDAHATFKYATEELGFSENNIIIFGRSIGTAAALDVSRNSNIRGLMLITPLTSGKAHAKATGLGLLSPLAGDAFNNLSKIKYIKSPLLVLHGTNDRIIPFSMGEEIFDAAQTEKKFVKIEGAGHNNLQSTYRSAYWPPIIEFINEHLDK
jgi:fermentation-respiration switch protein FrsA (DUF1100 family)